ncbi:hypothetical protein HPB50_004191 [Hyalomma asiaticum]|uniref:Uncharacterized protein n=1 Tax=Hyalomma asiaticum TaxID=266040 RepID=A0ACB7SSZ7_HYAAI|nr:hypothetical protein HPB50_004191 [Hyalomma asiaticum]
MGRGGGSVDDIGDSGRSPALSFFARLAYIVAAAAASDRTEPLGGNSGYNEFLVIAYDGGGSLRARDTATIQCDTDMNAAEYTTRFLLEVSWPVSVRSCVLLLLLIPPLPSFFFFYAAVHASCLLLLRLLFFSGPCSRQPRDASTCIRRGAAAAGARVVSGDSRRQASRAAFIVLTQASAEAVTGGTTTILSPPLLLLILLAVFFFVPFESFRPTPTSLPRARVVRDVVSEQGALIRPAPHRRLSGRVRLSESTRSTWVTSEMLGDRGYGGGAAVVADPEFVVVP